MTLNTMQNYTLARIRSGLTLSSPERLFEARDFAADEFADDGDERWEAIHHAADLAIAHLEGLEPYYPRVAAIMSDTDRRNPTWG